jgi:hypothetical protein
LLDESEADVERHELFRGMEIWKVGGTSAARFFFVQTYQNGRKIQNGHKLCQMAIKYTKW